MELNTVESHKENYPMQDKKQIVSLEILVARWRQKVYELLVDKKRYEIIIKENNRNFNNDKESLVKDKKVFEN